MYYSTDLFVKKGPLGKVWLAGTMMRKLNKTHIMGTDIVKICVHIERPVTELALPAKATLLRGVCRIEGKKAQYLLADAIEAKTHLRFQQSKLTVDLPKSQSKARYDSITLDVRDPNLAVDLDDGSLGLLPLDALMMQSDADNLVTSQRMDDLMASYDDFELDMSLQADKYREFSNEQRSAFQARAEDITLSDDGIMTTPSSRFSWGEDQLLLNDTSVGRTSDSGIDFDLMGNDGDELFPLLDSATNAPDIDIEIDLESDSGSMRVAASPSKGQSNKRSLVDLMSPIDESKSEKKTKTKRNKRHKRDRKTELSDDQIRATLTDISDIMTSRPILKPAVSWLADFKEENYRDFSSGPAKYYHPDLLEILNAAAELEEEDEIAPDEEEELRGEIMLDNDFEFEAPVHESDGIEVRRGDDQQSVYSDIEVARAAGYGSDTSRRSFLGQDMSDVEFEVGSGRKGRLSEGAMSLDLDLSESFGDDKMSNPFDTGSLASPRDRQRRSGSSGVMEVGYLSETPDFDVPLSQYKLPEQEEKGLTHKIKKGNVKDLNHKVSQFTRIFKSLLDDGFQTKTGGKKPENLIFKDVLEAGVRDQFDDGKPIALSRQDLALSFLQVLILQSMGIISVEQPVPYKDVSIAKGARWGRWKA